jgi:hypothetical protein
MSLSSTFRAIAAAQPIDNRRAFTVVIDTEEEFDWRFPIEGRDYTTNCIRKIPELQALFRAHRIVPAYLLTYPILQDPAAVSLIRRYLDRGECVIGIQLHAWVTPPASNDFSIRASFASSLPKELERRKFERLTAKFTERFGFSPRIYRAGRYGIGPDTTLLLEEFGFDIDTSVAPRSSFASEGGPEFSSSSYEVFWFGQRHKILELPLCRGIAGWGGGLGRSLFRRFTESDYRSEVYSGLARMRLAERITLSPEGNDVSAMKRLVQHMITSGRSILPLSFHSSSLALGGNPYVMSKADLHVFFDRLSEMMDYLTGTGGFEAVPLSEVPHLFASPALNGEAVAR